MALKGHIVSIETRKKIGNASRGRKHSEETKRKISLINKGGNKTSFKKGQIFSKEFKKKISEGMKGHIVSEETRKKIGLANSVSLKGYKHSEETKRKHSEMSKKLGLKPPIMYGKNNHLWTGDKVSYRALHQWVERYLGKPHFCEHCGNRNLKHRSYNWANKDGKYKRRLSDWIRLCVKCHYKFDNK